MRLLYWPQALKELAALPKDTSERIVSKMEWYVAQPDPLHYAKKLKNPAFGTYGFRVGDYRVICDTVGDTVRILIVLAVKHRREAYEDL